VLEERIDGKVVGHVKKYKIADKNSALEKAAKILGMFEADNGQLQPLIRVVRIPQKDRD
jgi:cell division protein FtsX